MAESGKGWRRCSACKKPIGFGAGYWTCSVSTCNRKRTGLYFCTVSCWEVHLPVARHREAWAEDQRAPSEAEAARQAAAEAAAATPAPRARSGAPAPRTTPAAPASRAAPAARPLAPAQPGAPRESRRTIPASQPSAGGAGSKGGEPREVLIIASRLKDYIRAVSGYNTSERVLEPLSEILRDVCHRAIRNARDEGRKTVLDRDIPKS